MPRATGPAADTAAPKTPTDTAAAVEAQTESTPAADPQPDHWRYVGEVTRTYVSVPVTVAPGDVIAHDGPPAADGCWQPDPGPATRRRDNEPHPDPAEEA